MASSALGGVCDLTNRLERIKLAGMSDSKHVVFVCTGNTCRSPLAEGLFRKATSARSDFTICSAGVAASKGTPCNPETAALLKKRGATLEHFGSQSVTKELLEQATHVFAMTFGHLRTLESRFPEYADKFFLVCDFVDLPGEGVGADVPDPIGMGRAAYEEVAATLDLAIPTLLAYIDQTSKKRADSDHA